MPQSVTGIIYDSGTSLIYMPTADYRLIRYEIVKDKNCYIDKNGDTYCKCKNEYDTGYPTIEIDIGKTKLFIESKWYMIKFNYARANPDCYLGITSDDSLADNYWLLGDTFLRAYLMIYDRGNKQIGFIR